ncbi:MAG: hypothetical protein WAW13_00365 [Minisyncoccia bacterium]
MPEWPQWEAAAIIASGPSTKASDVELLKGRLPVLAIKKNVELAPWADAVYGCDYPWWKSVQGLPKFGGLKMAYAAHACNQFGLTRVLIPDVRSDAICEGPIGTVGAGGSSGFQALNLAVQFGAKRILLIGFDVQGRSGLHWYGRNTANGMSNPTESNFRRWKAAFDGVAPGLKAKGIDVINAGGLSDIKGFRKMRVADALAEWGMA